MVAEPQQPFDECAANFVREITRHFAFYPLTQVTEATFSAWWSELEPLARELSPVELREVFASARKASPDKPPTAEQVRLLAEVQAMLARKAKAEMRQERLFPIRELGPTDALEAYYQTIDKALGQQRTEAKASAADVPMIAGLLRLQWRWYRCTPAEKEAEESNQFAGWYVGESNQRGYSLSELLEGLRKVPRFCRRPPTIGMVTALATGQSMTGWPEDWVAPKGDLL